MIGDSLIDLEEKLNNSNEKDNLIKVNENLLDSSLDLDNKIDPKNINDLEELILMGYDKKMVKKVYIFLKPADINEAIDFLSEENGIYHHDFMERHGKNDVCFICGKSAKDHINYEPKRKSLLEEIRDSLGNSNKSLNSNKINFSQIKDLELNIVNQSEDKKSENSVFCSLCMEDITKEEEEKNFLLCKHMFCSDCYLNYLKEKINNNQVSKITCLEHTCDVELDEDFIISHLNGDENLIKNYKKFKLRSKILTDPNVKFCPIKDCESYAKKEGDNKYVTCLEGHKFCFVCSKPWHGRKNCQDEIDKDFKKWKKNKVIKRCPNCKMWVEKNYGCNHMTCAECKYEWCWLCGGKYSEGHFGYGKCTGLEFAESNCFNHCICLYLYKLLILLYQMIMVIFIIPICIFHFLSGNEDNFGYDYSHEDLCSCMLYIAAFFWCIAYLGFLVSIGFTLFVFSLFLGPHREKILANVLSFKDDY